MGLHRRCHPSFIDCLGVSDPSFHTVPSFARRNGRFIDNLAFAFPIATDEHPRQRGNENSARYFYVYFRCIASATRLLGGLVARSSFPTRFIRSDKLFNVHFPRARVCPRQDNALFKTLHLFFWIFNDQRERPAERIARSKERRRQGPWTQSNRLGIIPIPV